MKKIIIIVSIIIAVIISVSRIDFGRFFCEELNGCYKEKVYKASFLYSNKISVQPIPCESFYLNVIIINKLDDTLSTLNNLHNILYDEKTGCGWLTIRVLNAQKEFIYDHSEEGEIIRTQTNL